MDELIPNNRPGRQLLNNIVDRAARATPDLVYAELPRSPVDLIDNTHGAESSQRRHRKEAYITFVLMRVGWRLNRGLDARNHDQAAGP